MSFRSPSPFETSSSRSSERLPGSLLVAPRPRSVCLGQAIRDELDRAVEQLRDHTPKPRFRVMDAFVKRDDADELTVTFVRH